MNIGTCQPLHRTGISTLGVLLQLAKLEVDSVAAEMSNDPRQTSHYLRVDKIRQYVDRALDGLERGVSASEAQRDAVDAAAKALEARNPNRACLRSPAARALLSGEWELLYTTSASILGATRPWPFRPLGPIFQTIDVDRLRARNRETFPFFNAVDADLTPSSASAVDVQFVTFYVFGFIEVTAPASARGALDVTYLDEELRVSRGDRGNLFVLRMADDAKRLPRKGDV